MFAGFDAATVKAGNVDQIRDRLVGTIKTAT